MDLDLEKGELLHIADIPENVNGFYANLTADGNGLDFDLHLYDSWIRDNDTHACLIGYRCSVLSKPGWVKHEGMSIYFSGDDISHPISEKILITRTKSKLGLYGIKMQIFVYNPKFLLCRNHCNFKI